VSTNPLSVNSFVQRLYLMQVATFPPSNNPAVCYLAQTADGTNILIDSGLPPQEQMPPGMAPNMGKSVFEQLAEIGLQPGDIQLLVCTHFDLDHAGNHGSFPNAELVVQREHYTHALDHERFANSRPIWNQPSLRYRFVEGDTELVPGLDLIETSGHTPGHQSVLVRLPETGAVILAIDAVPSRESFVPVREAGPRDQRAEILSASTRKLIDLAQKENAALVIFGHDKEQWATLKKAPDFYR
jgi:N-acyl homoserine lactone hydrolase